MHPILFSLGPFRIYGYGLFIALAFLTTLFLIEREAKIRGIPAGTISNLCLITFISSLLGARIMYVLANCAFYRERPLEIFMLHHGGLMFHGGFIAGLAAAWIYLRRLKLPVVSLLDIVALYLPIGQAIGRIGCLLNGCCFGKASTLPWAITLASETITRHPTQLYASLASIIIFVILKTISTRGLARGAVFSFYLILYPITRIIVEEFRADLPEIWMGLSLTQWFSVMIFIAGIASMAIFRRKWKKNLTSLF